MRRSQVVGMHSAAPLVEGWVEHHADLPRRRDGSQRVRVPRQRARSQRDRDRHRRLCRHSGGGRTRISTRGTPLSPHPDDVTHPEAFARPALTGFDHSGGPRSRWVNHVEPGAAQRTGGQVSQRRRRRVPQRRRTAPAGQLLVHLMACSILWSFERKLQIKPGRRVAVVNAPPGSVLTTMFGGV